MTQDEAVRPQDQHTWEGDASQVFHCTRCGLVTTSTDTVFPCRPEEEQLLAQR